MAYDKIKGLRKEVDGIVREAILDTVHDIEKELTKLINDTIDETTAEVMEELKGRFING